MLHDSMQTRRWLIQINPDTRCFLYLLSTRMNYLKFYEKIRPLALLMFIPILLLYLCQRHFSILNPILLVMLASHSNCYFNKFK